MTEGVTCRKCSARIDEGAFETKKKLCERLGKEYTPPKICSECWLLTIFEMTEELEKNEDKDRPKKKCFGCNGAGFVAGSGEYTTETCPECKGERVL